MAPPAHLLLTSLLFSLFFSSVAINSTVSIESLSATVRDGAFNVLTRRRTGFAYEVPLPPDLAGVRASVIRMRSSNLWSRGVRFSSIRISPRTTTVPYARRITIIRQDLGNWSSSYFDMPGYSLVAPVIGFLAYDASANSTSAGVEELDFRALGDPISITFPEVRLPEGLNSTMKCARRGERVWVQLGDLTSKNTCSETTTGHFTVVVPSVAPPAAEPEGEAAGAGETRWGVWVIACGGGVGGLLMAGFVGVGIMASLRKKKLKAMERRAEEGEDLGTVWAGRSKMPTATMSRTGPVIEDGPAP